MAVTQRWRTLFLALHVITPVLTIPTPPANLATSGYYYGSTTIDYDLADFDEFGVNAGVTDYTDYGNTAAVQDSPVGGVMDYTLGFDVGPDTAYIDPTFVGVGNTAGTGLQSVPGSVEEETDGPGGPEASNDNANNDNTDENASPDENTTTQSAMNVDSTTSSSHYNKGDNLSTGDGTSTSKTNLNEQKPDTENTSPDDPETETPLNMDRDPQINGSIDQGQKYSEVPESNPGSEPEIIKTSEVMTNEVKDMSSSKNFKTNASHGTSVESIEESIPYSTNDITRGDVSKGSGEDPESKDSHQSSSKSQDSMVSSESNSSSQGSGELSYSNESSIDSSLEISHTDASASESNVSNDISSESNVSNDISSESNVSNDISSESNVSNDPSSESNKSTSSDENTSTSKDRIPASQSIGGHDLDTQSVESISSETQSLSSESGVESADGTKESRVDEYIEDTNSGDDSLTNDLKVSKDIDSSLDSKSVSNSSSSKESSDSGSTSNINSASSDSSLDKSNDNSKTASVDSGSQSSSSSEDNTVEHCFNDDSDHGICELVRSIKLVCEIHFSKDCFSTNSMSQSIGEKSIKDHSSYSYEVEGPFGETMQSASESMTYSKSESSKADTLELESISASFESVSGMTQLMNLIKSLCPHLCQISSEVANNNSVDSEEESDESDDVDTDDIDVFDDDVDMDDTSDDDDIDRDDDTTNTADNTDADSDNDVDQDNDTSDNTVNDSGESVVSNGNRDEDSKPDDTSISITDTFSGESSENTSDVSDGSGAADLSISENGDVSEDDTTRPEDALSSGNSSNIDSLDGNTNSDSVSDEANI